MRKYRLSLVLVVLLSTSSLIAQERGPSQPSDISGKWTGTWSTYNPAQATTPPKEQCAKLEADVVRKGDVYEATFTGDCGRPYKYTIAMEGRQAGGAVLFKGTADLGPQDGGVYDWIGRADEKEFVGFFTSGFYTGVFTMTKSNQ